MNTEFNGYIFVDPAVEVGSRAIVDDTDEVIVMQLGKIFARVRGQNGFEWSVMANRLKRVNESKEKD